MEIRRVDTTKRSDVRRFVNFPFDLYRGCTQWVPPLRSDDLKALDRAGHPFYRHGAAEFFLAESQGQALGRLEDLCEGYKAVIDPRGENGVGTPLVVGVMLAGAERVVVALEVPGMMLLQGIETVEAKPGTVENECRQQPARSAVAIEIGVDGHELVVNQSGEDWREGRDGRERGVAGSTFR